MIRLWFLIGLLFASGVSSAQTPLYTAQYADSLEKILHTSAPDSVKARTSFLLANYWVIQDHKQAKKYLDIGKKWSKNDAYLQGIGYTAEGYYYFASDEQKSRAAYLKADSLMQTFKTKEAYSIRSKIWSNLGVMHQRNDDDKGYIDLVLNKSIPLAEAANDQPALGSLYVGVGVAFMNLDQHAKAAIYLDKAIEILKTGDPARLAAAYNRAGENYILLKELDKAKQVLDANRQILKPYPNSGVNAGFFMVEGMYFHERGQYSDAVKSFDQGIAKAGGPNKIYVIQELRFYKVKSLLAFHQYQQAKVELKHLKADEDIMSMDQSRLEIFQSLSEMYAGLHRMDSAFYYQKKSTLLIDSLHESKLKRDMNELEAKYKTAEAQKQITTLKAEKAQAALTAKNNRLFNWLLGASCLFLLTMAVLIWFFYQNHKKLSLQKEVNYRQQLKDMEQQQQLRVAHAMLTGEERERERVARDLHDGLGGLLAGVKLNLLQNTSNQAEQIQPLTRDNVVMQLDHAVSELRQIARNLMPETLLKFGLESALKDLCDFHRNEQLQLIFQSFGIQKTNARTVQIHIYRIIQEVLSNAVRHAQAHHILVQCNQSDAGFWITIEDDGKGFDPDALDDRHGMGIRNLESRVAYFKGKLEIVSAPGEGTAVHIELNLDHLT